MDSNIKLLILLFYIFFCIKTLSQVSFNQNNTITVIENNTELLNAWTGGLNFCQFSEIDLNLDGIKDILIFDRSGKNTIEHGLRVSNNIDGLSAGIYSVIVLVILFYFLGG